MSETTLLHLGDRPSLEAQHDVRTLLPPGYVYADPERISYLELARLYSVSGLDPDISSSEVSDIDHAHHEAKLTMIDVGIRDQSGQLIGFGRIEHRDGSGILCDLAVDPDHQGVGIGKAIIDERLRLAGLDGVTSFYIPYLEDTNPLSTYYEQHGFTINDQGEFTRGPNPLNEVELLGW